MPHLASNRPRYFFKTLGLDWEIVQATIYLFGILTFLVGSVLFLPRYDKYEDPYEAWLFIAGSTILLAVNGHDWVELLLHSQRALHATADGVMMTLKELRKDHWVQASPWKVLEWITTTLYVSGSCFYVLSSIFFVPRISNLQSNTGPWCLIIGSMMFMIGATLNTMVMYTITSPLSIQLLNAVCIQNFGGALLYLIGAVMYLIDWPEDALKMAELMAGFMFVIGSLMWTSSCISNIVRIISSRHFHFREGGEEMVLMKNQAYKVEMMQGPQERLMAQSNGMSSAKPSVVMMSHQGSYMQSQPAMPTVYALQPQASNGLSQSQLSNASMAMAMQQQGGMQMSTIPPPATSQQNSFPRKTSQQHEPVAGDTKVLTVADSPGSTIEKDDQIDDNDVEIRSAASEDTAAFI